MGHRRMVRGELREDFLSRRNPAGRRDSGHLGDLRFRRLFDPADWARLPQAVRARFSKRLRTGDSASYDGIVTRCDMSGAGWLLAQACRLFGAPLPLECTTGLAAVVSVTEDGAGGGQVWTRVYARRRAFPQVIHSAKRFAGPTGLEEHIGRGIGIALAVAAIPRGIRFVSDHYFVELGPLRMRLPRWLAPGRLTIDHCDLGCGQFLFTLALVHPLLGRLVRQQGLFRDRLPKP